MKNFRFSPIKASSQSGLTLIEVLVSMALGVFFLGIAIQYLVVGQQSNQVQDAGSRIQENARFANNLLREAIRLSGYTSNINILPDFIFVGNCGGFNPCSGDEIIPGANVGDSIAVSLIADGDISQDCLGNGVAVNTRFANVFWVQDVNGVRSLYCRGWDLDAGAGGNGAWISASQPLVDGIEQMQVQYGLRSVAIDEEERGGQVERFLSAAGVDAIDGWLHVRSVRVSLLVESGLVTRESNFSGAVALQSDSRTYALLDGPDYTLTDDRIRRVYTSTIELNNSFQ